MGKVSRTFLMVEIIMKHLGVLVLSNATLSLNGQSVYALGSLIGA